MLCLRLYVCLVDDISPVILFSPSHQMLIVTLEMSICIYWVQLDTQKPAEVVGRKWTEEWVVRDIYV